MPRLRRRTACKQRTIEVSALVYAYFQDDPDYKSHDGDRFALYGLGESREVMWAAVRDEILAEWIAERPGTRPRMWWRLDAPRWADPYNRGTMAEPRRRMGGTGTPVFECLAYSPAFECAVPKQFVAADELEYYAEGGGLQNHDHPGEPVEAYDPKDPPMYESQAAYLKRHGLLEEGEEERVPEGNWTPVPSTDTDSQ